MGNEVIQQRAGRVNPIVGVGDGAQLNTDENPPGFLFVWEKYLGFYGYLLYY